MMNPMGMAPMGFGMRGPRGGANAGAGMGAMFPGAMGAMMNPRDGHEEGPGGMGGGPDRSYGGRGQRYSPYGRPGDGPWGRGGRGPAGR